MKTLAREFSLRYEKNTGIISNDGKRNILKGSVGKHNVEIYDYGHPNYDALETYVTEYGTPVRSKRQTVFSVDGREEVLTGKISGYYPVDKIRQKILFLLTT